MSNKAYAVYASFDDEGCVIYFQGSTYYGRTGEDYWRDQSGNFIPFPEYDSIINRGNFTSRPASQDEIEKWLKVWNESQV